MDPFSISTGVAGFLSLTIELTKILSTYISEVKSAPSDAKALFEQLSALTAVLTDLREFLEEEATNELGTAFGKTSALVAAVGACDTEIQALRAKLRGFVIRSKGTGLEGTRKMWEKLRWPFEKEEIRESIAKLEGCAKVFQFSLSVGNW